MEASSRLAVLMVNKYLYPKGGAETHMFALGRRLARDGCQVRYFGMASAGRSPAVPLAGTIGEIDYGRLRGWPSRLKAAWQAIYSRPAYQAVGRALRRWRPHVAHLHNIYHQLSPSVLVALKRAGLPTIMTAHDYKLVCPTYQLTSRDGPCFRCLGARYWHVLHAGCATRGWAGAAAALVEAGVHRLWRIYERHLDLIVAPSRFLLQQLIAAGWPRSRLRLLPNPIGLEDFQPAPGPGRYLLFVGRLTVEKGLRTLVEASARLPQAPLWVAGDGPLRDELVAACRQRRLEQVRWLGLVAHEEVRALVQGARAVVLPSQWPENCPISLLEAFACAKPVVASRIGGIPELVQPSGAGWLVEPADVDAWASTLRVVWQDPDQCVDRGRAGRAWVEAHHDLDTYARQVRALYRQLLDEEGVSCGSR